MKRILFIICSFALFACGNNDTEQGLELEGSNIPEIVAMQKKVEQNPTNAEGYIHLANAYFKHEGYDEAIQIVKRAISIDSSQARYHLLLSDIFLQYNKSYDALSAIQKASGLFPDSIDVFMSMARMQTYLKQYDPAIQTLNQVIAKNIANDEVYYLLGTNYRYLGKSNEALANLKVAVELNADNLRAYQDLAIMCDTLKKDDLALKYFENALKIDSTNIVTLFAKGGFHNRRFQDEEAIKWYKKVTKYKRDYPEPYFNIGLIYLDIGSTKLANEHFNMTVEIEPTHSLGYYYRGLSFQMLGNKKAAINDYKQALSINPDLYKAEKALSELGVKMEQ